MPELTNQDIEQFFTDHEWKFRPVPDHKGAWELSFQMKTSSFTILVDNGIGNRMFLGIRTRYLKPSKNRKEVFQRLLTLNGRTLVSKFVIDPNGVVWIMAVVPRSETLFSPVRLEGAIAAVLAVADHYYVELLNLATKG